MNSSRLCSTAVSTSWRSTSAGRLSISFCSLLIFSAAAVEPARGEEAARFVTTDSAALRNGPAGELLGTVMRNSQVLTKEKKGDWTKITVEGWVRDSELSTTKTAAKTVSTAPTLEVAGFDLEKVDKSRSGESERIFLRIKIRNQTTQLVSDWAATLIVQDAQGNILVKTPVQSGKEAIKPQSEGEVNYYWTPKEPQYGALSSYLQDQGKLKVSLTQIQLGK